MSTKKDLTFSTNGIHTHTDIDMDSTAKTLMQKLRQLETEEARISQQIRSIRTALSLAGIKPGKWTTMPAEHEYEYKSQRPFAKLSLGESCEIILRDSAGEWLTKSQIEYLLITGGYESQAKNSKNSLDITLRRMADAGKCLAERVRGSRGNKYRIPPIEDSKVKEVTEG